MNEYAYLCHDDGTGNNTYLKDILQYKKVLNYKVSQELKKMGKENMDSDIINELFKMCMEGLLIDFYNAKQDEINLYILNNINTLDDLENAITISRKRGGNKKLKYDSQINMWKLSYIN